MNGKLKNWTAPHAPARRMNGNEQALLRTSTWSKNSNQLKLEDKVSLADSRAAFLQGVVTYVGKVHFDEGVWVGIQLTGPSVGLGNTDGAFRGRRYFANVGRKNGILAPISEIQKRVKRRSGDPTQDAAQQRRNTEQSQIADVKFVECLRQERAVKILKKNEEKRKFTLFDKEEAHITRLKQFRLEELRRVRSQDVPKGDLLPRKPENKYSGPNAVLESYDLELVKGVEMTQQNFCLSDPSLPDNPITFASQAFLNMTGYNLNEILGRNCRFLQGPGTDAYHIHRVRVAIQEGSDCSVCLLNYRADGSTFYNRLFITALRDTKGRIKNYLGVQCEVTEDVAHSINREECADLESNYRDARLSASIQSSVQSSATKNMSNVARKNMAVGAFEFGNFEQESSQRSGSNNHLSLLEDEDASTAPSTSTPPPSSGRYLDSLTPTTMGDLEDAFFRSHLSAGPHATPGSLKPTKVKKQKSKRRHKDRDKEQSAFMFLTP